ncbi:response regulator [Bacillus sp. AFS037270]|uniref:response regulator n=1 Tax=Bacillus sp. AFS037270 TaxID=2033499 RepID=UPI0020D27618|nr:response regulator [Bacillus sp. AFS037270]
MRLTIGKKMFIGFLAAAIFFGSISLIFYYYITKVNESYSELMDRRVQILSNTKDIQVLALQQTSSLRGYLLTQSPDFLSELRTANTTLHNLVNETKYLVIRPETKEAVAKLEGLNKEFQKQYEILLANYENSHDQQAASDYFVRHVLPIGKQLQPTAKFITERNQQLMEEGIKKNTELVDRVMTTTLLLSILAFISTIVIGLLLSRNITRNLFKITKVIADVTSDFKASTPLPRIEVRSKDETGDIAQAFNEMAKALHEQSWLETNITEMATMYQGIHDLETLAELFITKITPMMGASYGVFYVTQGVREQKRLRRVAAYAYRGQEMISPDVRFGEGLVGQAALENRMMLLTNIPAHYIQISSGTGAAQPASIIIMPVEFEGQVIAAIELASFDQFSSIQQTLLKQVLNDVGITINSVAGRMQIEKLLKESKALTEELQSQSEELRLQQEELQSINEKLEEQYKHAEQKSNELEKTKMELEENAEQLELSSKYKSEFLANMSHELRTPLNSLLILARLLADNDDGNLKEKQVEFARTIYSSGKDLLQLINDILDLSKVESGKIDIIPDAASLMSIGTSLEKQFLPVARQKGLKFTVQQEEGLPETIITDEYRLLQILKNLLSNAMKFTDQGKVMLRIFKAEKEALSQYPEMKNIDSALAFSVTDTGIGIPKEQQNLIFQAFHQGDGTTSRKYGGTGLGLSISKEIALVLGGVLQMESIEGKGSTITLFLPIDGVDDPAAAGSFQLEAAAALEEPATIEEETPLLQSSDPFWYGKKILIVDDDMRNIFALTTALEKKQMKVVFAENGCQGIKLLQENPDIELVLMDIMMPEMDGYEAITAIRQIPVYQALPIIALTAKAMKNDREKCIEAGASDYISKPVQLDQLFSLMQVWLYK